jgi:predicted nucleotidyltransferase
VFDVAGFGQNIVGRLGARVVILYGSAARGEVRADSDIDVVCFTNGTERFPDSYRWNGYLIDAWVHPLADAADAAGFRKLHDGRVLHDDAENTGARLVQRVCTLLREPRSKIDPRDDAHRRAWIWKMFDRSLRGGPVSDYRRHWLLFDLPETWCDLTQRHYLGVNDALERMKSDAPQVYRAFARALASDSSTSDLEQAVFAIVGARV